MVVLFKMEEQNEEDFCSQDEKKSVNEMVKAILILDHSKKPFKQSDISKYLTSKLNRKQWNVVLEKTKSRLEDLGMTLMEVKQSNSKCFILISKMFPTPSMWRFAGENELADRTLLILVLTFIFMKDGSVTDVDVFNHLQELNIYSEKCPVHDYFGDVKKKILNEFVSQLYLEKIVEKESQTVELKWGERAVAEVTKRSILEFVCKIGYEGTIEPKNLSSHYQIALEEEKGAVYNADNQEELMVVES